MEKILTLQKVCAAYGQRPTLHELNLEFPAHQITAVIGPSGCGKSTLLRCLNRMLEEIPDASWQGEICLNGQNIRDIPLDELRRRVGTVFQTPAPFPFSVYRNMDYALRYYGVEKARRQQLIEEKLRMVGLYDEVRQELRHPATQLSGGQQQRLCIARALTVNPEVLLLDEPCSALDVKNSQAIENLLLELKKQITIIIVTHNLTEAARIADQVVFLEQGRVIEAAPREQFFAAPQQAETRTFLGGLAGLSPDGRG